MYNLNEIENPVIPPGVYTLEISIRRNGCGPEGNLRLARNLSSLMLEIEMEVTGTANGDVSTENGSTFRTFFTVDVERGEALLASQKRAIAFSLRRLKSILDSHHRLKPDDKSERALKLREFESFSIFEGMDFIGRVDVEFSDGYGNQNRLVEIIVPGSPEWPHKDSEDSGGSPPSSDDDMSDEIPY
jgi:hypothetical protein